VERLVGRPVGGDDPVAQSLQVALQVGQRGAQLVRGVGDEVPAHLLLPFQRGGHLVERVGQAGHLLGAVARDAGGVVAVGDPTGRGSDLVQGASEHPGKHDGQADAGQDGHDGRRDDHRRDRVGVHLLGVLGRVAGFHHEVGEDVRPDDGHADDEDDQPDGRAGDGCQGDPPGQPADDHGPGCRAAR
jgi:hypothetical protein